MSWLDPFTLWFKDNVQLPARRRVALGDGLTVTDDPANDRLIFDLAPVDEGDVIVSPTTTVFELTRALGGDNFHGLAFTQANGIGSIGTDFSSGPVGLLKPVTIMRVDLSPDGGGSIYHPTMGLGWDGVSPGWLIHLIVTRGGGSTSLALLNGTDASDPLVTLNPADYYDTSTGSNHYRIHTIVFTGAGAQNTGKGWQRLTPYGAPAFV